MQDVINVISKSNRFTARVLMKCASSWSRHHY